jgi:MFS family permease
MAQTKDHESAWTPLREPAFRSLWIANVVSNVGGWMQTVGAAWLMTSLSSSPLMVTMVQSASSLPVVLLALPAGALADIADRRLILLVSQFWMLAAAAALTCLVFTGAVTPILLLALTSVLGLGTALMGPASQAVITELVPSSQLSSAVSLNSAGFNLARAVGPALGGIILAKTGAGFTFLLNSISFLAVILALYNWRPKTRTSVLPAERFVGAIRGGLRYVRYAPALQSVLFRTGCFVFFGSALWALLPLVVRQQLALGPGRLWHDARGTWRGCAFGGDVVT